MIESSNILMDAAYEQAMDLAGDGYSNESQRLLAHSRSTEQYQNDTAKVDALVAQGRAVIALHYCVYCQSTDGFLGMASKLVSDHASCDEAEAALELLNADADPEFYYALHSPAPATVEPSVASGEIAQVCEADPNDIPF